MFDISFPELLLILVVALVVIGPERLPRVARTMGMWVGRARSVFNSVRRDVEREAQLDELRKAGREFRKDVDLGLNEDVMKDEKSPKKAKKSGSRKRRSPAAPAGGSIADEDAASPAEAAPEPGSQASGADAAESPDALKHGRGDDGNT